MDIIATRRGSRGARTAVRTAIAGTVVLGLLLLGAGTAGAARGGHVAHSGATAATLAVAPNPVSGGGGTYRVNGSGYTPGATVNFSLANPECCVAFNVTADATGSVSFWRQAWSPGTYTLSAYQASNCKLVLKASTTFLVLSP